MNEPQHTPGYSEALARRDSLEFAVRQHTAAMRAFPRGLMGLTPDEVKFSPEYREAKAAFDRAFAEMRAFNTEFVKRYAKDIKRDIEAKRKGAA